jgi:ABC-type sugar transport system ATPase subunit
MISVEIKNICKSFQSVEVLKNVSLEINAGEFLVLVGPSGCGKSTLLRMIAGLETITSGDVLIDGKKVNDVDPKDRDIAMVFQNYALYPHMDVFNNMAFALKVRKTPEDEITKRVHEAAELLKISHLLQRRPKELSGGQRQRVALGRAIVRKANVFLFDEPLSNLDAKLRNEMRVEIKRLHHILGNTMIYVTHDQVEATTMGDRIAVLNDGVVQQIGSTHDLYRKPANQFVASFIGVPEMNMVEGRLVKTDAGAEFHSSDGWIHIAPFKMQSDDLPTGPVRLGARPESLSISSMDEPAGTWCPGKVEFIENLGSHNLVYCRAGSQLLRVLAPIDLIIQIGSPVRIRFHRHKCVFFEKSTGLSVAPVENQFSTAKPYYFKNIEIPS